MTPKFKFVSADSHIGEPPDLWLHREEITLKERWGNVLPGGYEPTERIKDQDKDNIEGEIIYPSTGMRCFGITGCAGHGILRQSLQYCFLPNVGAPQA